MSYKREYNYILDDEDNLVAFCHNNQLNYELYIIIGDEVPLVKKNPEKETEDEDCFVRSLNDEDITLNEIEKYIDNSSGSTRFLLIDNNKIDEWVDNDFAVIRYIDYYINKTSKELYDSLSEIYPPIQEVALKYFEAMDSAPEKKILWSEDWIGFTDSGTDEIAVHTDSEGNLNIEVLETFDYGEPEDMFFDCFIGSNLENKFCLATVDKIDNNSKFIEGLSRLLEEGSGVRNMPKLGDINMNFESVSNILNSLGLKFKIEPSDIELAFKIAKQKRDEN